MSTKSATTTAINADLDAKKHRALGALSYFWIFCFVPLVGKKSSPFVQFHAKQGVVVAFAWFVLWLLAFLPIINVIVVFPGMVLLLAVNILAVIRAWHGERWKIPFLYHHVTVMNL